MSGISGDIFFKPLRWIIFSSHSARVHAMIWLFVQSLTQRRILIAAEISIFKFTKQISKTMYQNASNPWKLGVDLKHNKYVKQQHRSMFLMTTRLVTIPARNSWLTHPSIWFKKVAEVSKFIVILFLLAHLPAFIKQGCWIAIHF
jgi:hypothetical protein